MTRFNLLLMRHSKSCSNHLRHGTEDEEQIQESQHVRDPGLSALGVKMATGYGRGLIARMGSFNPVTVVGASALRRARETAQLVFGIQNIETWSHFTENGEIPENTPEGQPYQPPNWKEFLKSVVANKRVVDGANVVAVGHGSFLFGLGLWLHKKNRKSLHNLDALLLDITVEPNGRYVVHSLKEYPWTGSLTEADHNQDKCRITTSRNKIMGGNRMRRTRKHRGGGGLPLSYFLDGNQMREGGAEQTGVGLGGSSLSWARAPLSQTGGFTPSIMSGFAANGMRLAPLASYVGYKQFSNWKSKRKSKTHRKKARPSKRT